MVLAVNSSLKLVRYLSNVHTWAISFLRHLTNMSSMVPFWASTDSGFVPNLGPASKPRRPVEVVYSLNDSCSHFTQRLFPPKLPQQHTCTSLHYTFTIIHAYYTHSGNQLHLFIYMIIHSFISQAPHGRLAALGPLCPLQLYVLSFWRLFVIRSVLLTFCRYMFFVIRFVVIHFVVKRFVIEPDG